MRVETEFLIIGAGVAGLRAAIEAAPAGDVLVLTKDRLTESTSEYAQGGIAVALSDDDEVSLHEQDTIQAGAGLCDIGAVRALVAEGPTQIEKLIEWGIEFDKDGGRLSFTREGAHSRNRVLHSQGDSTGREIAKTLYQTTRAIPNIAYRSFSAVVDILRNEHGEVCGVVAWDENERRLIPIYAKAVLLATGGLGCVYWETTNPSVATGDGMAMAYRAGAQLADMEMVQFHPTALFTEGAPRFLLSEALRGEGARLLNAAGEPFMHNYDERGDLAPRDIVSRAIVAELRRTQSGPAYLDLTHLDAEKIPKRFPRIYQTCLLYGIDITLKPVPVHPAAHYAMGGVHTDLAGRTSIPRLYAAGEVACTGVHGANRLASNSLLEGLVFGARAGAAMREFAGSAVAISAIPDRGDPALLPANTVHDLRRLAWRRAGIERFADSLQEGMSELERLSPLFPLGAMRNNRQGFEADNIYLLASLIIQSALAREESRGAHYRSDFPEPRPEFCRHSLVTSGGPVRFSDLANGRVAE